MLGKFSRRSPVNRQNWKSWERRVPVKSLIMDNQVFHSLIIKSFHNQTVSLPCQHINLGMFPWIVLEKTSGDKELGKIQTCQTSVKNGRKFLIHQFTFLESQIFFGPKNEFSRREHLIR
jgi:hypothetical protein